MKTKEKAVQAKAEAPARQPQPVRPVLQQATPRPVFAVAPRSNGIPAAMHAAGHAGRTSSAVSKARLAGGMQRSIGNARMGRMMGTGAAPAMTPVSTPGGLTGDLQHRLEESYGVPLDAVRIHTHSAAAAANRRMGSRAFAHGHDIYLGPGESPHDTALIAHEVAHVVQQQGSPVVQRSAPGQNNVYEREADRASVAAVRHEPVDIRERTGRHRPQFFGVSDVLDYLADKANIIPGFRMFTIVLGVNPINMEPVERSGANILRAIVEFIPGGGLITQVADAYGVFDKAGAFVEQQLSAVAVSGSSIKAAITKFIDSLGISDVLDPGGVWDRAKSIFTDPIDRILNVAKNLLDGLLTIFKDAILMPLAKLAEGTRGWDLLIAVLGKNPITGEAVPRTAETLVPGFLKLIGEEETWNNIKKANALARCWAWFQGALGTVMGFVAQVPTLFINALKSLELADIVLLPRAFAKVGSAFGNFIGNFITWAGEALWTLLQIIFDVVAPAAIPYLKKVGASFRKILKNPMGFVGNLVKAGKQGFLQFADNIGAHLKASFIEWLTGSLPGVYIPRAFEFHEIVKFALSVLGLTWANIRGKLVKAVGEPAVKAMEVGFDIVKTLVTEGPGAAWKQIKEQLANLQDMVVQGIMNFIIETVVKKAIAKIVAWLIPGAGFIDAIITIYDSIMVFIDKLKNIIQVATAFLDSVMAIANGAIAGVAAKVESTLAGLLTLAINFLAGFVGLGKVADKVMEVIQKVRAPIDKALDFVIDWIVKMAKGLFAKIFGGKGGQKDERTDQQKQADLKSAVAEGNKLLKDKSLKRAQVETKLEGIRKKFKLVTLKVVTDKTDKKTETDHLYAEINPVIEGERVTRDLTGESTVVVSIVGRLGLPQGRQGYERNLPSTSRYTAGSEAPHQRAHSQGPGTGRESHAGIRRAPVVVNQIMQNHGIEKFFRGLANKIKNDRNTTMSLSTETRTFERTLRLKSIQYQLNGEVDGKAKTLLVATIEVTGTKQAPSATASIDYVGAEFQDFLVAAAEEIFAQRLEDDGE